jgi:hypothetical protein
MARRTNVEILIDILKSLERSQASPRRLAELTGWDEEKVRRVVREAADNPHVELFVGPGGTVKHRGTERTSSNGLYEDLARILARYWGPQELGLRRIDCLDTSRGGTRGRGTWVHPDIVVVADPRRRDHASESRRLHAIEVETRSGFDIRSVYQAHAVARGADYSWVIGCRAPGVEWAEWDRITWTARALGVGIVLYTRPGAYTTWRTEVQAVRQHPSADERTAFIECAIGWDRAEAVGIA